MRIFKTLILILIPMLAIFVFIGLLRVGQGKNAFVPFSSFIDYLSNFNPWEHFTDLFSWLEKVSSTYDKFNDYFINTQNYGFFESFGVIGELISLIVEIVITPLIAVLDLIKFALYFFFDFYKFVEYVINY